MSLKEFGREEDIIDFDFQGWPVYKMNIRSILKSLGFECEDDKWVIDDTDPTLDIYPCVLEDEWIYEDNAPEVDEQQPNHIEYKYDIDYLLTQTSERSLIDSLLDYMSVSDVDEWLKRFMP